MLGYYENKEATQELSGWMVLHRDMGYLDSDGIYHITGRMKNVIITKNGKNVYPEELNTP
jgi:long-chain acyl-CoA synthetase